MVHGSPEGRAPYCFGVSVIDSIERARLYQPGSHPGEWTPLTAAFEIRDLYEPDGGLMELSPRDVGLDSELAVEYLLAFVAYFAALPRVAPRRQRGRKRRRRGRHGRRRRRRRRRWRAGAAGE